MTYIALVHHYSPSFSCPGLLINELGFMKSGNKKLYVREGDRGEEWPGERYINTHVTTFLVVIQLRWR